MIDEARVAENALTLLILLGIAFMVYAKMKGGKIKDSIRDIFSGDDNG